MVNDKKSINEYIKEEFENLELTEKDIIDFKDSLMTSLKDKNS
jgi:hypothetical protein